MKRQDLFIQSVEEKFVKPFLRFKRKIMAKKISIITTSGYIMILGNRITQII